MSTSIMTVLRAAHRQALRHAFYAVALSSMLALAIFAARISLTGTRAYSFLLWNLLLAWIPYFMSLWADSEYRRAPRQWWRLIVPASVWFLFFPNAPYILTDFIHLQRPPVFSWWYDVGLIAAFAWAGCFLGIASLGAMQTIVRAMLGRSAGWLFALGVVALSGLGVYLGRVQRWNSWDAFLVPHAVLDELATTLADRTALKEAIGISGMFGALLLALYLMYMAAGAAHRTEEHAAFRNRS